MPYGRPMKGASRRVPTTVHIPTGTLDIIDNYIDDREKDVETGRMEPQRLHQRGREPLPCGTGFGGARK